jgi:hypothetical protein
MSVCMIDNIYVFNFFIVIQIKYKNYMPVTCDVKNFLAKYRHTQKKNED